MVVVVVMISCREILWVLFEFCSLSCFFIFEKISLGFFFWYFMLFKVV